MSSGPDVGIEGPIASDDDLTTARRLYRTCWCAVICRDGMSSVDPLSRLAATYSLGSFLHLCHSSPAPKKPRMDACGVMAMRTKAANSVRFQE